MGGGQRQLVTMLRKFRIPFGSLGDCRYPIARYTIIGVLYRGIGSRFFYLYDTLGPRVTK